MKVNAGRLRHRIQIQEAIANPTDFGEKVLEYQTVATRWAEIEPGAGSGSFTAGVTQPSSSTKITIRYFADLTILHRIKFGDRFFNVSSFTNPEERNIYHIIQATEQWIPEE